ncbi:MAG TPA: tRNA epoxyqueuosine(34) reductase QueG [Bacteroidales bacterium]|nr:tRNA epoxyqueuosine(34) reductase QueG [Bacteroidales bacterium]
MKGNSDIADWIKAEASALGFDACGIARAGFLEKEAPVLERWLRQNMHGTMQYMENYFDKRLDPRKLLEGAQSVIVLVSNYFPETPLPEKDNFILSKYAYGTDYHFVIRDRMRQLIERLREKTGDIAARGFVDSAPLLERAWASRAGLGWIGKNANFIIPRKGSFYFLSEIITDLWLPADTPKATDLCGACRNCIDACPTQAIVAPGVVDVRRCISYLTIELRDEIPEEFAGQFHDRIFGCDICQDVCPWNRFQKSHSEPLFAPNPDLFEMTKLKWQELTQDEYRVLFKKSPVKRAKYHGLMRNIRFAAKDDHLGDESSDR